MISVSLVAADVPALPPPRSLISPRKPHQQTSSYLWNETLSTPMMIAWMELTSADLVRPFLPPVLPL